MMLLNDEIIIIPCQDKVKRAGWEGDILLLTSSRKLGKGFKSEQKINQEMTHSCITVKCVLSCVLFTVVTACTQDPSHVRNFHVIYGNQ